MTINRWRGGSHWLRCRFHTARRKGRKPAAASPSASLFLRTRTHTRVGKHARAHTGHAPSWPPWTQCHPQSGSACPMGAGECWRRRAAHDTPLFSLAVTDPVHPHHSPPTSPKKHGLIASVSSIKQKDTSLVKFFYLFCILFIYFCIICRFILQKGAQVGLNVEGCLLLKTNKVFISTSSMRNNSGHNVSCYNCELKKRKKSKYRLY